MSNLSPPQPLQASSEWVRWVQSQALPVWTGAGRVLSFASVAWGGLSLVARGLLQRNQFIDEHAP